MVENEAVKRYAKALIEMSKPNQTAQLVDHLKLWADMITENRELLFVLSSSIIDFDKRKAIIRAIAIKNNDPELLISFLSLLLDKKRISLLPAIYKSFSSLYDLQLNRTFATVVSAHKLSKSSEEEVIQALSSATTKNITASFLVDETLLGGIKAQIDGKVFDLSIKNSLDNMEKNFILNL